MQLRRQQKTAVFYFTAGPFSSDPGWREALWWLGIPVVVAFFLVTTFWMDHEWYLAWVHPEGYGILEVSHFILPLLGMLIVIAAMSRTWIRYHRPLLLWLGLLALGCFYIAGEEHSWGQHFWHWDTPKYWSELNRQQETNLHNVSGFSGILDKVPRMMIELGIVVGGLLLPLADAVRPTVRRTSVEIFLPASALMATAIFVVLAKVYGVFSETFHVLPPIATRTSEVQETFIYIFILFYIIILYRRIGEVEHRLTDAAGDMKETAWRNYI